MSSPSSVSVEGNGAGYQTEKTRKPLPGQSHKLMITCRGSLTRRRAGAGIGIVFKALLTAFIYDSR